MKKFFQYALACTLAFTAYACSEDENTPTPPPSKGEQAVEQVINVLEEKPELIRKERTNCVCLHPLTDYL